jgi:hypothetical protein
VAEIEVRDWWSDVIAIERARMVALKHLLKSAPDQAAIEHLLLAIQNSGEFLRWAGEQIGSPSPGGSWRGGFPRLPEADPNLINYAEGEPLTKNDLRKQAEYNARKRAEARR